MFSRSFTFIPAILLTAAILVLAGCSGNNTSTSASGQGSITAKLVWEGDKLSAKSVASAPAGVVNVRLAISGPSMTTVQNVFPAANGSGTLSAVPVGSGLTLTASGLDSTGAVTYVGSVSGVTVQAGKTAVVGPVTMTSTSVSGGSSLIGSWVSSTSSQSTGYEVVTFLDNSNYFQITTKPAGGGNTPGLEKGTYTYDATTGSIAATTNFDTDGSAGFNGGSTGAGGVTVSGNTLTFNDSSGTYTFNRLTPSATNPIVGSWGRNYIDKATGKLGGVLMVFLDNTNCLLAQAGDDTVDPTGQSGVEQATYTWNQSTGLLTTTVSLDTNGEWGFASPATPVHSYTASITGTTLNMSDPTDPTWTGHLPLISNTTPTVAGVWRATNGAGFNYLSLYENNTFVYAENDLTAPPGDNGVEKGTYTYDGTKITFNITYDRNGPGQNSGIGEIGTLNVYPATLSNNSNTLTLTDAGGQLVFLSRAAFNPTSIVGSWRTVSGAKFSYLILFNDNTFMYAENDPAAPPGDNGLEAGTYTYDGTNITFNITYDDNGPGQNSGVGNIGTPKVSAATLSNNGNTLTVFGGQIVLTRAY